MGWGPLSDPQFFCLHFPSAETSIFPYDPLTFVFSLFPIPKLGRLLAYFQVSLRPLGLAAAPCAVSHVWVSPRPFLPWDCPTFWGSPLERRHRALLLNLTNLAGVLSSFLSFYCSLVQAEARSWCRASFLQDLRKPISHRSVIFNCAFSCNLGTPRCYSTLFPHIFFCALLKLKNWKKKKKSTLFSASSSHIPSLRW